MEPLAGSLFHLVPVNGGSVEIGRIREALLPEHGEIQLREERLAKRDSKNRTEVVTLASQFSLVRR